jgi:hypothetical protein
LEPDPDHTGVGKRATAVIDTAAPLLPRGFFISGERKKVKGERKARSPAALPFTFYLLPFTFYLLPFTFYLLPFSFSRTRIYPCSTAFISSPIPTMTADLPSG